jgi:hypothetical protein
MQLKLYAGIIFRNQRLMISFSHHGEIFAEMDLVDGVVDGRSAAVGYGSCGEGGGHSAFCGRGVRGAALGIWGAGG